MAPDLGAFTQSNAIRVESGDPRRQRPGLAHRSSRPGRGSESQRGGVVTRNQDNNSSDPGHDARMRMAAGDEVFFKYYWPRLVRYLKARAVDTNLAEDVAADAMIAFMDQWDYLFTHPRPDSWLFKVATRKLRK